MDELLDILNEINPDVDYEKEKALVDDRILDSLDIVTLISEISDRMDITIPAQEIVPENFNSVQALYQLLLRLEED